MSASPKLKTKNSKAGVFGAIAGVSAYAKSIHNAKTPAAISRDVSKAKVLSVFPRSNSWIVRYEWDYHGDGSNWRKDKYEIESTSTVRFNARPLLLILIRIDYYPNE